MDTLPSLKRHAYQGERNMKRMLTLIFVLGVFAFLAPQKTQAAGVPMYEYWNPVVGDHFYTTNINELGYYPGNNWTFEGVAFNVYDTQVSGTTPLFRYYNYPDGDHFYTADWNELGYGAYGWYFENVEGYVYPSDSESGIPLFEYWNENGNVLDHFYTTDWNELGSGAYGWNFSDIPCRVEPAD
jgi:hypothetical protein